jgi:hypothetical protein
MGRQEQGRQNVKEDEFRERLIDALRFLGGGQLHGPSGLEGLSMAIAGSRFVEQSEQNVASSIYAVAAALERIADALEKST